MVEFAVKTYAVTIEPHPDADLLECARIGDYFTVVGKGQMQTGDVAAYIPEASVVPDKLIAEMELEGKLAGSKKNRVKAIKLRGVLSQGLVYPMPGREIGEDVTEQLGIVKYEPPIPSHMAGQVQNSFGKTLKFDIENIKLYPNVFEDGEEVVFTEKLHGTWCCMGFFEDTAIVSSKGISDKGLSFKMEEGVNITNLYVQHFRANATMIERIGRRLNTDTFYVLGEIFGKGVQDLHYGLEKPNFRVFDIFVGEPAIGRYLDYDEMRDAINGDLDMVPLLYRGPFSRSVVDEYTNGVSTLAGHIREGLVIRPVVEDRHFEIGRKLLKSVSENYLLRKGGTELN